MARRKKGNAGGSLDSLLDTMTNVVGILVIVLVVTQLGVGDAVNRIGNNIEINPQTAVDAERAAKRRSDLEGELAQLKGNGSGVLEYRPANTDRRGKYAAAKHSKPPRTATGAKAQRGGETRR